MNTTRSAPRSPRISRSFLLAVFLCLISLSGYTQLLSLDTVLKRIELNNPALSSYRFKIQSAREMAKGAKSWMPPTLSYEFDSATLAISQMLPNIQKQNARKNYLLSLAELPSSEEAYLKNQLFASAKTAYFKRQVSEQRLKVIAENSGLINMIIDIAGLRMAYNKSDLQSVYSARARLYSLENMSARETGMIQEATATLNYLMNQDLMTSFNVDSTAPPKKAALLIPDITPEMLENNRSDIQKMNHSIISMQLNKDLVKAQAFPDFGFKLERRNVFNNPHPFMVEVMMTLPLLPWVSKEYRSEARSMDYQILAMEQDKTAMLNMAGQMIRMRIISLNTAYQELDNYENKIIPAYKKNFEITLQAYQQNTTGLLQVLMAWEDLQMAGMDYLNRLENTLLAEVELEKELEQK